MFTWRRSDRLKKLRLNYADKHEQALDAERNGNIPLCTLCHEEAEKLLKQLEEVEAKLLPTASSTVSSH